MTAPDDVRARFEAWATKRGLLIRRAAMTCGNARGPYDRSEVQSAWEVYRAAHADLSGEVRELVDDALWLLSQIPHNEFSHDYIKDEKRCGACKRIKRIAAVLAKHTHQEKKA